MTNIKPFDRSSEGQSLTIDVNYIKKFMGVNYKMQKIYLTFPPDTIYSERIQFIADDLNEMARFDKTGSFAYHIANLVELRDRILRIDMTDKTSYKTLNQLIIDTIEYADRKGSCKRCDQTSIMNFVSEYINNKFDGFEYICIKNIGDELNYAFTISMSKTACALRILIPFIINAHNHQYSLSKADIFVTLERSINSAILSICKAEKIHILKKKRTLFIPITANPLIAMLDVIVRFLRKTYDENIELSTLAHIMFQFTSDPTKIKSNTYFSEVITDYAESISNK